MIPINDIYEKPKKYILGSVRKSDQSSDVYMQKQLSMKTDDGMNKLRPKRIIVMKYPEVTDVDINGNYILKEDKW
jgi:hypothetical protein